MGEKARRAASYEGRTHRLEALADGVFSIVLTFLVFNITLPKDRPVANLARALLDLWPNFLAFTISCGLVGIYWSAHKNIFIYIKRTSHELNWLNILFLALVSLVPFSTSLVAGYHDRSVALCTYGMNLVFIGISLLILWLHATSHRRLVDEGMTPSAVRYGVSRILLGVLGYGLASVLSLVHPPTSLTIFAAVPLLYIIPVLQRLWRKAFGL